jgi:hypothetical protein
MPKTTNPGHITKLLSSAIFSAFLSDLQRLTDSGLKKPECDANKEWLNDITNAAAALPESNPPAKTILDRCNEIYDVYDKWNYPERSPAARDDLRRKLQYKVQNLATAYGQRIERFEADLDLEVYRNFYDATERLLNNKLVSDKLAFTRRALARFPHLRDV